MTATKDLFATTKSPFETNNTPSGKCGVTLMNNQIGAVMAEVMKQQENVTRHARCRR